jgi:hypothetical protein
MYTMINRVRIPCGWFGWLGFYDPNPNALGLFSFFCSQAEGASPGRDYVVRHTEGDGTTNNIQYRMILYYTVYRMTSKKGGTLRGLRIKK